MSDRIERLKREGRIGALSRLIPYAQVVGLEVTDTTDGPLTVLKARSSNVGNTAIPAVHGGVVGGLLEHAAVMLALAYCEPAGFPKIVNLSVDYLRPCKADIDTFAGGVVVKLGRNVANVRVEAWQEDAKRPVAAAHAHFLLVNGAR